MNKNKKYILIALLASLLFTVTIGFSVWIILSEQARGYIQAKGALTHSFSGSYYIGYSWDGEAEYTYTHDTGEQTYKVKGKYTIVLDADTRALSANDDGTYTCKVLFQPSGGFAQWVWGTNIEFDQKLTLNTVAKIGSDYYVSIDGALKAANGNTVTVLKTGSGVAEAKNARTIGYTSTATDPITIQAGVTLLIPYDEAVTASYKAVARNTATCTNLAYYTGTVNNYGTITISAEVTGDQCAPAKSAKGTRGTGISVVAGSYAYLQNADANAELVNAGASAVINCYGYLDGTLKMDKGTANLLFSFMDHRGGRCMYVMSNDKNTFPILRYYLASVGGNIHVQAGAVVNGRAFVEAGDEVFETPITLIGTASNLGFVALEDGANATLNYDKVAGKNIVDLYGDATINEIAVSLAVDIVITQVNVNLSTADSTVPVPYLWEFNLHCLEGQSSASVSTGETDLSLLPGSKILVDEGVTLTVRNVAIYEAEACDILNQGYYVAYGDFDAAELLIKGTLVATGSIGGEVKAGGAGATFKTQGTDAQATFTTNDLTGFNPDSGIFGKAAYTPTTHTLQLAKVSGSDSYSTLDTYYSAAKGEGYAWYSPAITVELDANGGDLSVSSPHTVTTTVPGAGLVLSELDKDKTIAPTLAYHTFSHWCTDANCDIEHCSRPASIYDGTGVTLYAIWIQNQYTIRYRISDNGSTVGEFVTLKTFTSDEQATFSVTLPSATEIESKLTSDSDSTFVRWSSNASNTGTVIDPETATFDDYIALASVDEKGQGTITIYAYCASIQCDLTLVVGNGKENIEISGVSPTYNPNLENDTIRGYLKEYNENFASSMYLEGWYADATYQKRIDFDEGFPYNPDTLEATIYAKWAPKTYMLTLNETPQEANVKYGVTEKSIYFNEDSLTQELLAQFDAKTPATWNTTTTVSQYYSGWSIDDADAQNSANYTDYTENGYEFKRQTFNAKWTPKHVLTIEANSNASAGTKITINSSVYVLDENQLQSVLTDYTGQVQAQDHVPTTNMYFANWAVNGSSVTGVTLNDFNAKALTLEAVFATKHTITLSSKVSYTYSQSSSRSSSATVGLYYNGTKYTSPIYVMPGDDAATISASATGGGYKNGWLSDCFKCVTIYLYANGTQFGVSTGSNGSGNFSLGGTKAKTEITNKVIPHNGNVEITVTVYASTSEP